MVSKLEFEKVVVRIVNFYHPDQPILFGSYAYGMPHEGSDPDLLIVKETHESPDNRTGRIRNALKDFLLHMDILVYTPTEIAKDRKFTFIHDVFKLGKVLNVNK